MADILQGTSSATWGKPEPGPHKNPKFNGVKTDNFDWGEPVPGTEPNKLGFTGLPFDKAIGQEFEIGKLNYFNGTMNDVTTVVDSVPLQIELDLDSPTDETQVFKFDLELETTVDTSPDINDWADFVYFPSVLPTQTFDYDGTKYTLELTGFSKDDGKTMENRFRVLEQEGDVASLYGKITKAPKNLGGGVDPNADTDGAIDMGNLNDKARGYRNTDEIGFTEGGVRDLQDVYKFTIGSESEVNLTLDQLKRNANVEILDTDGNSVLFQSTEANRKREEITENLEPGTYFVRVYPEGNDRTKYRLAVSADALADEKDKIDTAKYLGFIGPEEVSELDRVGFGRGKNRDEQDYFKFSISEESEFFLTLDQLKKDANVEVLDSSGKTVLFQSLNSGRKQETISEDLAPGDYYARIFPQGSAKTDYRLGMTANPIVDEDIDDKKPGIDLGAVTPLSPLSYSQDLGRGTGRRRDQVDYYTFTVAEESDVNITLDRLKADINIDILDKDGDLMARGDRTGRKAERMELESFEAGTYTVKVYPNGSARSNYRLGITADLPYVDDYPTPEEALDLGAIAPETLGRFNNEMGRTFGRSGRDEKDWIRFEITEGGLVDLNLGRLRQDINLELYDDDGETILNKASEKGRANENISVFLDEGTYFAKVVPKGNGRSDYRFTVTAGSNGAVDEFDVSDASAYSNSDSIGVTASGVRNTIDRYKFSISEDSDVDIFLGQLRGDANIKLLDGDGGTLLFDSNEKGRKDEEISASLDKGNYIVEVLPQNAAKTQYLLDIFAGTTVGEIDDFRPGTPIGDLGALTEDYSKVDQIGFGNGSSRDENDYYKFSVSGEQNVSISLEKLSANVNIELLDSSGSVLTSSRKKGKANESIEEDLDAGDYFVRVYPQGSARGNYTLNIAASDGPDLTDPDGGRPPENVNDIGTLTSYSEGDSIGFREGGYRDVNDYRKFTLAATNKVDIDLTGLSENADLELIDSDGRTLLKRSATGGSSSENINTTLDAGDYYVRVLPKGAASTDYDLNMSASPVTDNIDDEPPGIALGTVGADPLTQGGLIGFKEGGKTDTNDYYNFVLDSPGFANVELDGLSGNANLELYDRNGTELIGSSTNSGSTGEEIQTFLSADTYVVRVFGQGSQTPYDLSVAV